MSLVARALETAGIATVVIGSAMDIVTYCGIPRYVFTDFPLGNPCGRPWDEVSQRLIFETALHALEGASEPGFIHVTPLRWSDSASWKSDYMRVGPDNIEALRAAGEARRAQQAALRPQRDK